MEKDIIIKAFKRFLKEQGVYSSFCHNFKGQTKIRVFWCDCNRYIEVGSNHPEFDESPDGTFKDYINKMKNIKNLVNYAFNWSETNEGHKFWNKISDLWMNFCVIKKY